MSDIWIRRNGQKQLRENLRAAIKRAKLTQWAAAEQSGVKHSRLIAGLGSNRWFTPDEVDAFAAVLKAPAAELIGDSIFKGDPSSRSLDYYPPELEAERERHVRQIEARQQRQEPPEGGERAICCKCGSLRTWNPRMQGSTYVGDLEPSGRMLKDLKCAACREVTRHALLRDGPRRDVAEERDYAPTRGMEARAARDRLIEQVRGFNADVAFDDPGHDAEGSSPVLSIRYDRSKSRWRFEINEAAPPGVQLEVLRTAWKHVATGEFPKSLTWDPAERGVCYLGSNQDWVMSTDDLVDDICRFMDVEQRRAVDHLTKRAAHHDFDLGDERGSA